MNTSKSLGALCMIVGIFVACSRVSWGQQMDIVSPSEAADVEGDDSNLAGPSGRVQMLFPAADFMSLPDFRRTIVGLAWRPDQSNTFTDPMTGPARISLSTTTADSLSTTFADNLGDGETLVVDGTITFKTDDLGPGPRNFDLVFPFDQPFTYDPSQGNLLVDFVVEEDWDRIVSSYVDTQSTGTSTFVAASDPSNPVAVGQQSKLWVTQFTFVPEPSTSLLATLSFLSVALWRRRSLSGV